MSKHTNKHWLREKEFISLEMELDLLWTTLPLVREYGWRREPNTRVEEINKKINLKFYNFRRNNTAPKWFRKTLNRRRRYISKRTIYKGDYLFDDNYKDAAWRFW
jgi:hypothetical protein